jgi:hypothetical protein
MSFLETILTEINSKGIPGKISVLLLFTNIYPNRGLTDVIN